MIEYKDGNIVEADTEAVVNPCNCLGAADKGVSLEFKKVFPDNYKAYKKFCDEGFLKPGQLFVYIQSRGKELENLIIVNFATKDNWRNDSKIEWIKNGLEELHHLIVDLEINSISLPKLGCGNGNLQWDEVKPLIVALSDSLPKVRFVVYE